MPPLFQQNMVKNMNENKGMQKFSQLFVSLDQTTSSSRKIRLFADYLNDAIDEDRLWAIALFSGKRPKRTVQVSLLRTWIAEIVQLPEWLFEESYHIVGDLAETIALLLPEPKSIDQKSLTHWINYIRRLQDVSQEEKKEAILLAWQSLDKNGRFIFNKIITGGFRVGLARKSVVKSLSVMSGRDENQMAHRLIGQWHPDDTTFEALILQDHMLDDISRPYPFLLAYPLEESVKEIPVDRFQFEYKWDGIRGQLISRKGEVFLWSRGEELVTDRYPEYHDVFKNLKKDVVLDGEVLAYKEGVPLDFQKLQKRIGRKSVGKKTLADVPVIFMAYDVMEHAGEDIRHLPLSERRKILESIVDTIDHPSVKVSELVLPTTWEEMDELRIEARERNAEGLMVKEKTSTYEVGRKKGLWWKWKVDPMTIDAVMLYAMRGHGRRSGLYTDLTFAVWDGKNLVPFTKAYSGLTDEEFRAVTNFVNKNTKERFGPVRSVKPELVFELAFEGIAPSSRHKSGVALRFPRIKRWRHDKKAEEANTLDDLKALL